MARERVWSRNNSQCGSAADEGMLSRGGEGFPLRRASPGETVSPSSTTETTTCAAPTLTLKLGNVCFELAPNTLGSTVQFQSLGALSHTLRLENFTGLLRVIQQANASEISGEESMTPILASQRRGEALKAPVHRLPKCIKKRLLQVNPFKDNKNNTSSDSSDNEEDTEESKRPRRSSEFSMTVELDENTVESSFSDKNVKDGPLDFAEEQQEQSTIMLGQPELSQSLSQAVSEGSGIPQHFELRQDLQVDISLAKNTSSAPIEAEPVTEKQHVSEPVKNESTIVSIEHGNEGLNSNDCNDEKLDIFSTMDEDEKKINCAYDENTLRPARVSIGDSSPSPTETDDNDEDFSTDSPVGDTFTSGSGITLRNVGEPTAPDARWGHTFTKVGDNFFILYGGQTVDQSGPGGIPAVKTLHDLHIYQADQSKWIRPVNWLSALPRQWHTSTFLPDQQLLLVFGGEAGGKKLKPDNQIMLLDTDIMVWYPPSVSGQMPTGRSGHSATLLAPPAPPSLVGTSGKSLACSYLVVFGGAASGGKWLNTISVLDVNRWIWFQPKCQGVAPQPRCYHTATAVGNNRMVVFGGNGNALSFDTLHVLTITTHDELQVANTTAESSSASEISDAKKKRKRTIKKANKDGLALPPMPQQYQYHSWTWTNPDSVGDKPSPRTGHSATLLKDGKTICIYGGWDPNDDDEDNDGNHHQEETAIFDDCFLLDTTEWKWSKGPKIVGDKAKRVGHTAMCFQDDDRIHIFGGRIEGDLFTGDFAHIDPIQNAQNNEGVAAASQATHFVGDILEHGLPVDQI